MENNVQRSERKDYSLEEYLEALRSKADQVNIEDFNPNKLAFNKTGYTFVQDYVIIGGDETIPRAREERKRMLENMFDDLINSPDDDSKLVKYAEELWHDKYHEKSQELLAIALAKKPDNPQIYHLLSRINLDLSHIAKRKKSLSKKYAVLAGCLADEGLKYATKPDEELRLVEDTLDSLSNQGIEWGDWGERHIALSRKVIELLQIPHGIEHPQHTL